MANYDFRGIAKATSTESQTVLPSEALIFKDTNKAIEELVDGYQTLTVTGRGPLGFTINNQPVDGADGARFIDANLPVRQLDIEYLLMAPDSKAMISRQIQLNQLLYQSEFTFSFNDDPDWFYTGTVSDGSDPEKGMLNAIGSFSITCSDPFAYSDTITSSDNKFDKVLNSAFLPDEIDYTPSGSADDIKITNENGQVMSLAAGLSAGSTLQIFPQKQKILLNGTEHSEYWTYDADVENFLLYGQVSVTPGGTLVIKYRRRRT